MSTVAAAQWKRPESILVLVATVNDRYLLMERVSPVGFWQSVTGSLETDESPAHAAHRELVEETGIDALPVDLGYYTDFPIRDEWRHRYAPDVTSNREHVFAVTLPSEVPVALSPLEHRNFCWLSYRDARQQMSSPTNRAALDAYRKTAHSV